MTCGEAACFPCELDWQREAFPCLRQCSLFAKKMSEELFLIHLGYFLWLWVSPDCLDSQVTHTLAYLAFLAGHGAVLRFTWAQSSPCSGLHMPWVYGLFIGYCWATVPHLSLGQVSCISCRNQSHWRAANQHKTLKPFEVAFPHGWKEVLPGLIWPKRIKTKVWRDSQARRLKVHFKTVGVSMQKLDDEAGRGTHLLFLLQIFPWGFC